MATDMAFALPVIILLGKRVPASLKVFLAALAIADDLCEILVIALFYSTELHMIYLAYAGGILALLVAFNRLGVKHLASYMIPGLVMWYFVHHSHYCRGADGPDDPHQTGLYRILVGKAGTRFIETSKFYHHAIVRPGQYQYPL